MFPVTYEGLIQSQPQKIDYKFVVFLAKQNVILHIWMGSSSKRYVMFQEDTYNKIHWNPTLFI